MVETVNDLKAKGNDLYKQGRYEQAADAYSKALQVDQENSTLYSNRSAALSQLGRFHEALYDACQCIDYSRGWDKGYFRKIVALEGLKDYPNVMEAAEEGYKQPGAGNQMKKEFVKRWFNANQNLYQLPPNHDIEIPRGIYIISQKYFNILLLLLRSLNGKDPLNSDIATQCVVDCVEQMDTILKCFGEAIDDASFLYDWAKIIICEIYPYIGNPSENKQEIEKLVLSQTDKVVSYFQFNVDSILYPLLRPLFALIVLIVLNRTNILTESNAGHHSAEIMNRALIPFFETEILNTKEYQYLYIGRLCAILDSFVGRLYRLNDSEKETVKFYYGKLQKALDSYPVDLPDQRQYKALGERCMSNIDENVLDRRKAPPLVFVEEITTSNALKALEFGKHEKVDQYMNKRYLELSSIESPTMGEVEELLSMTEVFSKLEKHAQALESFKRGEKSFFDVLGTLLEKNALKLDQCPTTIAIFRQLVFNGVKLLNDPIMYSDVAFRWKCLFTHVRALIINLGFRGSIAEFFINYIDSMTTSPNDESVMTRTLAKQMEKEELLLPKVAKEALDIAYSCNYDDIVKSLDSRSLLLDYVFFTTVESDPSLMEATCIIMQHGNDPIICHLNYDKIRRQSAVVIDVISKARKLYWSKLEDSNQGRIHFELGILADLLFPDSLKSKLLSDEIEHLYVCLEGDLALIPFGMFPVGKDGKSLDQIVTISHLGSIHQLKLHKESTLSKEEKICYIVADPNFNCHLPKPATLFNNIASMLSQYLNIAEPTGAVIEQLGDPAVSEADFISYTLCNRGMKVQQWLHDDANLKNLMSLKHPFLLHICTHAYTDSSRTVYRGNFFADLSSGLALAGFNTMSKQLYDQIVPECSLGKFPSLAVLSLDLRCTKLVYLSTCESASGLITTQEELVSLSSAFLSAGVETVIATLWRVNNDAAAEFSKYFYDHLVSTDGIRPSQALTYASKKISEDPVLNHWSNWGAYVCYGADKPLIY